LLDCKASIANNTLNFVLPSDASSQSVKLFDSNHEMNTLTDALPHIKSISPVQGPTTGNTNIVISGISVEKVDACRFRTLSTSADGNANAETIVVSASVSDSGDIICVSPKVRVAGRASVDFSINSKVWLTGIAVYDFYAEPSVTLATTLGDVASVHILGSLFPTGLECFCKLSFMSVKSGKGEETMILPCSLASSTHARCDDLPYSVTSRGYLTDAAISFNGVDYFSAPLSSVNALSSNSSSAFEFKSTVFVETDEEDTDVSESTLTLNADQLRSITHSPVIKSMLCNGNHTVTVPYGAFDARQGATYLCVFNDEIVGEATFIHADALVCNIPSKAPGTYELLIRASDSSDENLVEMPNIVEIICLNNPLVLSGEVSMDEHGSQVLAFSGLNFETPTDF